MRIGFEVWDSEYYNMDFSKPYEGNPGVGGATYAILTLAYYYQKCYSDTDVVLIVNNSTNKYWDCAKQLILRNESEIGLLLEQENLDIYVSANSLHDSEWYDAFKKNSTDFIYVLANFITRERLAQYKKYDIIRRVVFVGKEQYDRCLDDDIIEKAYVIGNIINNQHDQYRNINNAAYNVTYMGALLPQKGFHLLAKQWKKILKRVPKAQLYIIGSGKLYSSSTKLGKYGISTESYEKQFMPYLLNEKGQILDSVHFMGTMGREKEEIFLKTAVGVVNPSGETETFCNSAVEMQGYGIPIVTIAKNSFFDVIDNKKSGLLFYSEYGFRHKIVKLLLNKRKNEKMGIWARRNSDKFTADELIPKWHCVFEDICQGRDVQYVRGTRHFFYNAKVLRIINRFLRMKWGIRCLPSFAEGISTGLKKR